MRLKFTDFSDPLRKMITPFSVMMNESQPSKRGGQAFWTNIWPENCDWITMIPKF
jgi:hypothetical protein